MSELADEVPLSASKRVLVVAGEASGDRYGAGLMEAVGRLAPGARFTGIGGALMRRAGLTPLMDAEKIAVLGFVEVLTSLPVIRRAFRRCVDELASGPDLCLLIDYPGFNLRLAKEAKRAGVPVVYFVSPQVWAWKPGRVKQISQTVDQMLVIFPFEEEFYRQRGVEVTFVGHPLLDILKSQGPRLPREAAARRFGLDPAKRIIGLLPGSRRKEARRNLPPILGAARLLQERIGDLQFMIPVASTLPREAIQQWVDLPGVVFTEQDFYEAVHLCEAAIVSSGTATMEVALLQVPMVVVYRLNPITFTMARAMTDLPHVAIVNLVAGKRIVPELIQADCTPQKIAAEVERLLTDRVLYERTRRDLRSMQVRLGQGGAFERAAEAIAQVLRTPRPAGS